MAETFRFKGDVLTIEVNDAGDVISIPLSDEMFNKKLYMYLDKMQKLSEDIKESDDIAESMDTDIKFHEALRDGFNDVFGDGAYAKLFGSNDILVGIEYIMEFINFCMPYIQKHSEDRLTKLNKYSADRVGSSL